jgi:hypothetical protein
MSLLTIVVMEKNKENDMLFPDGSSSHNNSVVG